jgi:exopolysaccharide production protein ExoZ
MELLGDSSYALYLLHLPIITAVCAILTSAGFKGPAGIAAGFIIALVASVGAGAIFYLYVERPILNRLSGRLLRRSAVASERTSPAPAHQAESSGDY